MERGFKLQLRVYFAICANFTSVSDNALDKAKFFYFFVFRPRAGRFRIRRQGKRLLVLCRRHTHKPLPELFRHKRHERMQEPKHAFIYGKRVRVELELLYLEIPIAEFFPHKIPERLSSLVIAMRLESVVNYGGTRVQSFFYPHIFRGKRAG